MGELERRTRLPLAGLTLTVGLCLSASGQAVAQVPCGDLYQRPDVYDNVKGSLNNGDCSCARYFFTELGHQNEDKIDDNLEFFDRTNREIFRCEVEARATATAGDAGAVSSRVRALGR